MLQFMEEHPDLAHNRVQGTEKKGIRCCGRNLQITSTVVETEPQKLLISGLNHGEIGAWMSKQRRQN
ncbi:unnamed protein product [Lasius platythorax]|uniref:Uncharacterized protein n=1 Tax=Lasius platythorax TaxID=488582 RepID=A0AAV2NC10_9HYME